MGEHHAYIAAVGHIAAAEVSDGSGTLEHVVGYRGLEAETIAGFNVNQYFESREEPVAPFARRSTPNFELAHFRSFEYCRTATSRADFLCHWASPPTIQRP